MTQDILQQWSAARAEELPGAYVDHPFGDETPVFRVREKMFMLHGGPNGVPLVSLKVRPEESFALQRTFEQITPGWHLNKKHWISLHPGSSLTQEFVNELVTDSYVLVVAGLPKRLRPVDPETFGL